MHNDNDALLLPLGTSRHGWPAEIVAMVCGTMGVLRQVRQARGLKLSDVAPQCGISESGLSRVELVNRGMPRLPVLLTMTSVLDVRLSAVLRIAEDEAFPLGSGPWTGDVADLLRVHSMDCLADLDSNARQASRLAARQAAWRGGDA